MRSCLLLTCLWLALAPWARGDNAASADPKARRVLDAMAKAYRDVRTLEQETVYSGGESGPSALVRSRLVVQRPNRILFEVLHRTPQRAQPVVARFQCDGKEFFSYQEAQGWYTREKAPKNFSGFREIASSIEMAALTGINPFEELEKQARSVRLDEPAEVDAVMTDVVLLDVSNAERTGAARLYIGQRDHLLRRFTYETEPHPKPEPPKSAQPQPPLDPEEEPAEPLPPPRPFKFGYDNHVLVNAELAKDTFTWVPPQGAFLFENLAGMLAPKYRKDKSGIVILGQQTDASKPTKVLTQRDLFNMAKRQRK